MTPEERLTRIENAIQALTETQAQHEAGIRDLIIVSRTLVESQKESTTQILGLREDQKELRKDQKEFREAQRRTDEMVKALTENVNRLTENVDRLIRFQGRNGHGDEK